MDSGEHHRQAERWVEQFQLDRTPGQVYPITPWQLTLAQIHATLATAPTQEGDGALDRLYAVAGGGEVDVLDELVQRAELRWQCPACPWVNAETVSACESCGAAKPVTP